LTSTATGLATATVRTSVGVASSAVHGALALVRRGDEGPGGRPQQPTPEPVRVPTPPDPAVAVAKKQAEASAAKRPARKTAKKAPSAKAATTAPATAGTATSGKAGAAKAGTTAAPKPAPPKKKASQVPLKSDPTPASAAPQEPEGPDVRPGDGGASGLAEPEPLFDPGVAAQVRTESAQLRSAAE